MTSILAPGTLAAEKKQELVENVKSAILIDRDTGTIMYEKTARKNFLLPV